MAQTANDMRTGWIIQHNGRRYSILSTTKVKPGKGGAFIVADIRDIDSGNKGNDRWRAEDRIEKLVAEDISCQYLYGDGANEIFMRLDDYEQFTFAEADLGEQAKFLQPDMNVVVNFIEGKPGSVSIPKTVVATIASTEPALRGQTQSGSGKPAVLDNGVRITVPTFIETGEKIIVNTETLEYSERAK
jgi:elongation factor P